MTIPTDHLVIRFSDGTEAGWDGANFFGDEKRTSRAIIRCEIGTYVEHDEGLLMANMYTMQGAFIALVGSTDCSKIEITSSHNIVFKQVSIPATIGAWHD